MIIVVAPLPIDPGKSLDRKIRVRNVVVVRKEPDSEIPGTFNFRASLHGRFPVIFYQRRDQPLVRIPKHPSVMSILR
jgi:hypothetical protein